VDANRVGNQFQNRIGVIENRYEYLVGPLNDTGDNCLAVFYNTTGDYLELVMNDCSAQSATLLCRKYKITSTTCNANSTFEKKTPLEFLLDPSLLKIKSQSITLQRNVYKDIFKRLNQTAAYKSIVSNMWFATLPCFDIKGMTSTVDGEAALLKYCEWKGVQGSISYNFLRP